jgi:hypothetical protein
MHARTHVSLQSGCLLNSMKSHVVFLPYKCLALSSNYKVQLQAHFSSQHSHWHHPCHTPNRANCIAPCRLQIALSGRQFQKRGPRDLIALSLAVAGGVMLLFVVVSRSWALSLLCLFVSGAAQALVFPQSINALSMWYTDVQVRTTVLGVWGACSALAGLAGTLQANAVRGSFGWRHVYWVPACAASLTAFAVHRFLRLPSGTSAMVAATDEWTSPSPGAGEGSDGVGSADHELLLPGDTHGYTSDVESDVRRVESGAIQSLGFVSRTRTCPF